MDNLTFPNIYNFKPTLWERVRLLFKRPRHVYSIDPASPHGDYSCRSTHKVMDGKIYYLNFEFDNTTLPSK